MNSMFSSCSSMNSIDLSNLDTSNVKTMSNMFDSCFLLETLDLSDFKTISVTNMEKIFKNCTKLIDLDISNFDTSLKSLNLTSFDTKNAKTMRDMFNGCSQLTSLNLTHFDTTLVESMIYMFSFCSSLVELDLSSFSISNVETVSYMFDFCSKLEYINLKNAAQKSSLSIDRHIFLSTPINMVICIDVSKNSKINEYIQKKSGMVVVCSEDWKEQQKKIIYGTENWFNNCNETENNKYNYENICYENCPSETHPNSDNICEIRNVTFESDYIYQSEKLSSSIINEETKSSSILKNLDSTNKNEYKSESIETNLKSNYISTDFKEKAYTDYNLVNDASTEKIEITYKMIEEESYIERINSTIKEQIIHTLFPTFISDNNKELFYDNSNLFPGLNNTEIFDNLQDYIKEYSTSEPKNTIFKGENE